MGVARGAGGHGPSLNVKKEKIKKKFLEDTEKVKCLMSIYKKLILEKKKKLEMKVIERFTENPRHLVLL